MAAIAWERIQDRTAETTPVRPALRVAGPPVRRHAEAVYRRRRLAALLLTVAVVAGVLLAGSALFGGSASAGSAPVAPVTLVAQPGDSYWSLAGQVHDGGDIRSIVDALVDANGGRDLRVGDRIPFPR